MKINRRKIISMALALALMTSVCGCGAGNSEPEIETVKTDSSVTTTEATDAPDEEETEATTTADPLADDYDPYGGGGAATQVMTSLKLEDTTETTAEEKTESSAEKQTKTTTTQPAVTTVTEKSTTAAAETKAAQTETAAKTEEKKQEENASEDVSLDISVPNGWSDGTADYSQIDGTVKNKGKKDVNGWTATITMSSSATVEQSWNCEIELKNGVMTVKPVEHNKAITPGGEGTFGMIIKNPGKVDTEKSSLTCSFGTYQAGGGNNNNNNNGNSSGGGSAVPYSTAKDVPAPTTDDWLFVKGNKIVDSNGKEVWLTGVNWFGYNTGTNTFDGLWACDLNSSLASIADHGFNLLRVPISAELVNKWAAGEYPEANYNHATNSYLNDMNSLEIFDYVIGQCRANGLKIMMDIHSAKTDSMGHMKNVWYDGNVTESDYISALSWLAERYKSDDTVIAYDLKNEPHGKANENPRAKWDNSKDSDNWKYVAEKAAKAVLSKNPNVLIMVEGIEIYPRDIKSNGDFSSTNPGDYYSTWWGGNLRGVKDNPIDLGQYQNKLVYSPHDYGPAVYEQEWFKGDYNYESLKRDAWNDNWLYIHDSGTAPLLIGEWGGFMTQPNLKWMTYMRQLIKEKKINHTFWCFNANSGDTGGLVKDDFVTWDNEKYEFVKEVLWQEDGKFVGLDHQIPLGENGKTLS